MRNSVLETDGQTDGEKSALVELRFAAKKFGFIEIDNFYNIYSM